MLADLIAHNLQPMVLNVSEDYQFEFVFVI